VFHVLNRAVARHAIFQKDGDYEAFERVFAEALEKHPIRVLSYCLMPNHWHMVLWPAKDGDLTDFVRWLTHTHTMRWARPLPFKRDRPSLSRAFQVVPDSGRRPPLHGASLRGAECVACQLGRTGGGLEMVEPASAHTGDARVESLLHDWPLPMPTNWLSWVKEPRRTQN